MKKLFNLRPILFIAISICCGIATTYFFMRDKIIWGIFFATFFAVGLSLFLFIFLDKNRRKVNAIFACIFLLFFIASGANFFIRIDRYESANLNGGYYQVTARVDSVSSTDTATKLILSNAKIDGKLSGKISYKIALYVYGENLIKVGDNVKFSAYLNDKDYVYEEKFNATDIERGIKYTASVGADKLSVTGNTLTIFERVNSFIKDTLKQGFNDEFSIPYALLTGNSSFIDVELISAYRTAGVAHIFAVSGLHIGFLAAVLTFIFKRIKINPYIKAVIITLALSFYSGVCGFTASSLRATVMTAVALFARANYKRYDPLSSVGLSAIIILLVSPVQLLCVGFQLSFAVVLGIITLSKPISKPFKFLPNKLADALGVVLSAQLVSIPISLIHFGTFSYISVIANLIFVPIVSVIFTATLLAVLVGGIFNIAKVILFPLVYVFRFVNTCVLVFDQEFFTVGGIIMDGAVISYFAVLVIISGLMRISRKGKVIASITLSLICATNAFIVNVSNGNAVKMYVSGSNSVCATLITAPKENALIISDTEHVYSISGFYRVSNKSGVKVIDNLVFMGGYPVDMQVFITKLYSVFEVRSIYYYGERDAVMEDIIKHAFSGVKLYPIIDGAILPSKEFRLQFALDGNVIVGNAGEKSIAIFSSFKKTEPELSRFSGEYDIMVACDRADGLISLFKPKRGVSYRYSSTYEDAISSGNLTIKLN